MANFDNNHTPRYFDCRSLTQDFGILPQSYGTYSIHYETQNGQNYQHQSTSDRNHESISTDSLLNFSSYEGHRQRRSSFPDLQPNIDSYIVDRHSTAHCFQSIQNAPIIHQKNEKKWHYRVKRPPVKKNEERMRLSRIRANNRERKRMHDLNNALDDLRGCLNIFSFDQRLSKIDALRLGTNYIAVLTEILNTKNEQPNLLKMTLTLTKGLSVNSSDHISRKLRVDPRFLDQALMK